MQGLACALIGTPPPAGTAAARARDLTVSWLRWGYFGDIAEGPTLSTLLHRLDYSGARYALVQGYGHIVSEHAGPHGGKARSFFDTAEAWVRERDFIFAGIPDRCLLVDIAAWKASGEPTGRESPPVPFGPTLSAHLLDLGADLSAAAPFQGFLSDMCDKAGRGVFVLNYESYVDVEQPAPGFTGPVSTLYCVAAGLKPNRILETHGIGPGTKLVFFDYSSHALDFRRRLDSEWNGRDYPAYLRGLFAEAGNTHFYLWPGATPDNMDWAELERLWQAELARWGGADAFADHWRRFQAVERDYLACNILDAGPLLDRIQDEPGSAIWWSNAFCTIYSATHYSLAEKQAIYERWIDRLATRAPGIFLYGADHGNSSVNGMNAADYHTAYHSYGGSALLGRPFHRQALRF